MAVYFIQAGHSGPVKIGRAADPQRRATDLQTAHYEELTIIRLVDGGEKEERMFHKHFASLHIRGEWFRFSEEMMTVDARQIKDGILSAGASALQRAVDAVGGQVALARKISDATGDCIKQGHVWHWLNKSKKLPPQYVAIVSAMTGVPNHELRPDVFAAQVPVEG